MAQPGQAHGVVRVGIVMNGKLESEHRLPLDQPVSIGPAVRDTIRIRAMPASVRLFERSESGIVLSPALHERARVRRGNPTSGLQIGDRGKVTLDGVRVLYQVVRATPALSVPDTPTRWLEDSEAPYLQSLAIWSAMGLLLAIHVATAPLPPSFSIDEIPDRISRISIPSPPVELTPPAPEPEPVAPEAPTRNEVPRPSPAPAPNNDAIADAAPTDTPSPGRSANADAIERLGNRLQQIGTTYDTENAIDVAAALGGDSDLDDTQIAGLTAPILRGCRGCEDGPANQKVNLDRMQGGDSEIGGGSVVFHRVEEVEAPPTARKSVRASLKKYNGQIRYCYESVLKTHPEMAGRLEIVLDVENGRVLDTEVTAKTFQAPELEQCIAEKSRRWSFDRTVDGEIIAPFVFSKKG